MIRNYSRYNQMIKKGCGTVPRFLKSRTDLPFDKDDANRFIPWVMGLMVFLATLALVGAATVSSVVNKWDQYSERSFKVEVAAPPFESPHFVQQNLERQHKAMEILEATAGVKKIHIIANSQPRYLTTYTNGGPMPVILEVTIRDGYRVDLKSLQETLSRHVSEIIIHDNQQERLTAVRVAQSAVWISVIVSCLLGLAAVVTIAFVTLTGLSVHRQTLDVLNIVGARRNYIAKLFQEHATRMAFKGGLIGVIFSLLTLAWLRKFIGAIDIPFVVEGIPSAQIWFIIVSTPIVGIILTAFAAKLTVLSALSSRVLSADS